MAVEFDPRTGGLISVDPLARFRKTGAPISEGGRGKLRGRGRTSKRDAIDTSEREAALRKEEERQRIEKERGKAIADANQRFKSGIRTVRGIEGRRQLEQERLQAIFLADLKARGERVQSGIVSTSVKSFQTKENDKTINRRIEVNPANVKAVLDEIKVLRTGRGQPTGVIPETEISRIITEEPSKISPQPKVISARVDRGIVEKVKDPNTIRRIKSKIVKEIKGVIKLPTAISTAAATAIAEQEAQLAAEGIVTVRDPSNIRRETAQIEEIKFLTDKELEKLSFGGLNELAKRKEKELNRKASSIIKGEQKKLEPEFQKGVDDVVKRFNEGTLDRSTADKLLKKLERDFVKRIEESTEDRIDVQEKSTQEFINTIAKRQRKVRAAVLAPIVFGEGFLFGSALRGVTAPAGRVVASAVGEAPARLVTGAGIAGILALQAPQITSGLREDPTAFILENAPFLVGVGVGANPKIVKNLRTSGSKLIEFERELFRDKRAKATGGKQRTKTQQQQTKKGKTSTRNKLKEIIKKANDKELKEFLEKSQKELNKIKDPAERALAKQRLASTVLEAKTGISIIDESGNINLGNLGKAQEKFIKKAGISIGKRPPTVEVARPAPTPRRESLPERIPERSIFAARANTASNQARARTVIIANINKNIQKTKQQQLQAQTSLDKQLLQGKLNSLQRQLANQRIAQSQAISQAQALAQKSGLAQKQVLKQKLRFKPRFGIKSIGKPFVPIVPFLPVPKFIKRKKKAISVIKKKQQGYNAFAKSKKRFIKLNLKPLTRRKALDLAAVIVDRSIAATGKIEKAKKPAQKPALRIPQAYLKTNERKFRFFKQIKGRRISTPESFIEKRRFRLDTRRETQSIQAARKRLGRVKKPVKKSNAVKLKSTRGFK